LHALAPVLEHRQGVDRAAAAKGVLLPGRRLTGKTSQQVLEELPSPIATTEDINNGNLLPAAGSPTCCAGSSSSTGATTRRASMFTQSN
jgi:hypothetical protein